MHRLRFTGILPGHGLLGLAGGPAGCPRPLLNVLCDAIYESGNRGD
jgi:hypothetical protein